MVDQSASASNQDEPCSARPRLAGPSTVDDNAASLARSSAIAFLGRLSKEELERVLSFLVGSFPQLMSLASVDRRTSAATRSAGAWEGASITVPREIFDCRRTLGALDKLSQECWGLAAAVKLPAHRERRGIESSLRSKWPNLRLLLWGDGPHLFFVMNGSMLPVGSLAGLHFFEPRYRWMCSRVLSGPTPHVFGWVNVPDRGLGMLCEITDHERGYDGTYDVTFRCVSIFEIVEHWEESVPASVTHGRRAPALNVGYTVQRNLLSRAPEGSEELSEEDDEEDEFDDLFEGIRIVTDVSSGDELQ